VWLVEPRHMAVSAVLQITSVLCASFDGDRSASKRHALFRTGTHLEQSPAGTRFTLSNGFDVRGTRTPETE